MAVLETEQTQELINYSKETGYEELPKIVSESIAKIRKTFANAITIDIDRPFEEQLNALVKACKENNIEIPNEDLFCYNDWETLRVVHEFNNPTTNETGEILVDIFIGTELHDENGEETEENKFLICPDFADIVLSINEQKADTIFQDVVGNQLAKLLKGDNVRLQINYNTVMESGKTFVYDGCHKLYVITSDTERAKAREYGYIVDGSTAEDETEHPISELEEFYLKSCPLRFVETMGSETESMITILPQDTDLPMFIYF